MWVIHDDDDDDDNDDDDVLLDESEDDFEEVPEKEGYEEDVPRNLKTESGMKRYRKAK